MTTPAATSPGHPAGPDPIRIDVRRRRVAAGIVALPTAAALAGLSACQGATATDRALSFTSLAAAEVELARLSAAATLRSAAVWTWAQTLAHCAQSIEYSMLGFPESKSALFQNTVGAAALGVFGWRGRMSHDRTEPIPGAPALDSALAPAAALARLQSAVAAFRQWSGPLRPHFAYGALDQPAYERAHAMHLADHLSQFDVPV
jgi:Protein of unknown function (DUF1569)